MRLFELGCSTSGDDGVVALAGQPRPAMRDADEPVVDMSRLPRGNPSRKQML